MVIEAYNNGADSYIQKGGEPGAQFAELTHKIRHAISRSRADQALRKSEQDYRHLFDNANKAIFIIQEGYIRTANLRSIEMSGYPEQEIINQPFSMFVHPDDREVLLDQYRKRIDGEEVPSHYLFRLSRKDGTIRWVDLGITTITWDGHPATLNFLTDITQRKLAEDAFRESEERYRQFFKTTRDSVFITTPEGQWIDFNDALVELFGCASREEVFGTPVTSIYAHPEERTVFLDLVERNGYIKEHPVQFRKRDGKTFDALITIATQKNPDGSLKAFIGTIRDLTTIRASLEKETEKEKPSTFDP